MQGLLRPADFQFVIPDFIKLKETKNLPVSFYFVCHDDGQ